ncbi:prepilin-type N-terminal cleavage/methylation domain-containing protein [Pseudomonas sp. TH32]|uniref:PilW family protein n=1 Tax=unclassified Pseudomonas TaxID=196821 RepID=UPI0019134C39|nr:MULTISPECIES: prepilin-type N-terminal cleavage/methylation domain-containing protein [unclassified Pseudomonas]MBK5439873.1 prepilin-type N-terminal cleavage/methylation domain-containing protein [Pseudomonas sp. TH32]MDF3199381.1 prepilin-type N-terminal cleavage/methylation domain-containing protein [Pseudomonas sp. 1912-s]
MRGPDRGFSLVEMLLAFALGLVLILGVTQIALSSRITHASQRAASLLQDDARFVLGKLIQEIRQAGMFGCLSTASISNVPAGFDRPIGWSTTGSSRSLTLVTADVGEGGSKPDWTVLSDCTAFAQAYAGSAPAPAPGQIRFPLRRLTYTFEGGQLKFSTLAAPSKAVLVDNVRAFDISFGVAGKAGSAVVTRYDPNPGDESLIRSVRILLTLQDPAGLVKDQTYSVVAALRNRLE